jgi:hypothetical protein
MLHAAPAAAGAALAAVKFQGSPRPHTDVFIMILRARGR